MLNWIEFVKEYARDNDCTYKQALSQCKGDWEDYKRKMKEPVVLPKVEPVVPEVITKDVAEVVQKPKRKYTRKPKTIVVE